MANKKLIKITAFLVILIFGICVISSISAVDASKMKVTSSGIKDGKITEKYGMYGSQKENGIPTLSIPLKISKAPKKTKFYAVYMYDNTYPWVHWTAANYKSKTFKEGASKKNAKSMVQGKNDFGTLGYGGPTPPDKTHTYTIKVYALKSKVTLHNGFTYAQFKKATKGKVLSTTTIKGQYVRK